jgi:hypothetical protein
MRAEIEDLNRKERQDEGKLSSDMPLADPDQNE